MYQATLCILLFSQYHLISPDLDAAQLTFDRDSDWFFLRLNPVRVEDPDGQERMLVYYH